ncbi:methylated-DNA--protein-cysteine methyltransferase isoform X2 [Prionailurus viverrinus]|uniref:methylated-DNA--protein-cysteine methyltransferase isoform X2 n=1 Tax=Prionailurus viverrinus TaxID=61388 RepID=UPI001FF19153|nr:methylated-DNA--protein-cysteine methyltransferase isoform X2 [Prionailurus viverrinus]
MGTSPGDLLMRGLRHLASPGQPEVRGRMDKTCKMNYKVVDSPLGEIEISACEQGVHEIRLHGRKTPDTGATEAPPLPELLGCPGEMTAPLKQCVAWLDAYFHEPAALKDLPLPAIHHPVFQRDSFTRQVLWKLLKVVRLGETVSYRQLAALAGRPRAARAVGGAMRTNPFPHMDQTLSNRQLGAARWPRRESPEPSDASHGECHPKQRRGSHEGKADAQITRGRGRRARGQKPKAKLSTWRRSLQGIDRESG